MAAHTAIVAAQPDAWQRAKAEAQTWRGQCIELFARAEASVSEMLLALSKVNPSRGAIELPHLVGARFEALLKLVGSNGPFRVEGEELNNALVAFREHDALRATLCHAIETIAIDRSGDWHLILKLLAFRSGRAQYCQMVFDQSEAKQAWRVLARDTRRLEKRGEAVRGKLAASKAVPKAP